MGSNVFEASVVDFVSGPAATCDSGMCSHSDVSVVMIADVSHCDVSDVSVMT